MRTMIGKRIGPVPIALVAVLALAAFVSAGLWLTPTNGAQAENLPALSSEAKESLTLVESGTKIPDQVLDVNETITDTAPAEGEVDMRVDLSEAFTADAAESVTYAAVSDNTAIPVGSAAQYLTIAAVTAVPEDNTATVTVTATAAARDRNGDGDTNDTGDAEIEKTSTFTVTVIENPIRQAGTMFTPPVNTAASATSLADSGTAIVENSKDDGACEVVTDGSNLASRVNNVNTDATTTDDVRLSLSEVNILLAGGDCTTSDDSVDVVFKSINTNGPNEHLVYVTGGSMYKGVMPQLGKGGLDKKVVMLADSDTLAYEDKTITVAKSMADKKGVVYLIGYGNEANNTNALTSTSTTFVANADFVVKVLFLEAPDADETTITGDGSVTAATQEITVTVMDENGNPVKGVNVDFTIVSDSSGKARLAENRKIELASSNEQGVADVTVMSLPTSGALRVGIKVDIGESVERMIYLYRNGDPAEIMVKGYAECSKADGCSAATDDMPIVKGTGDSFFVRAAASDEAGNNVSALTSTALMVVGSDDASKAAINGTPERVNTDDEIIELWEMLGCAEMKQFAMYSRMDGDPPIEKADGSSAYCAHYEGYPTSRPTTDPIEVGGPVDMVIKREARHWFKVSVDGDADAGTYSVKATTGAGASLMSSDSIEFTVAGEADSYGIYTTDADGMATDTMAAGAEASSPIRFNAIDDAETYVLMVRDSAGNVPSSPDCVNITMSEGTGAALSVKDTDSNDTACPGGDSYPIGAMGNIEITVSYDFGIEAGTVGRLTVKDGSEVKAYRYFQFGRDTSGDTGPTNSAPRAVGTIGAVMMTVGDAPMMVNIATRFADADGDALSYDVSSSDMSVATASVDQQSKMVAVSAVGAGEATITVSAYDGVNTTAGTQSFTVTVSEPVDTTLGMPSGLMATAGDGMVTLSWTAGANADGQRVAGIKVSDWRAENFDNVILMDVAADASSYEATGLDNDDEYAFTIGSFQTDANGMRTYEWHAIEYVTPAAASSGQCATFPFC